MVRVFVLSLDEQISETLQTSAQSIAYGLKGAAARNRRFARLLTMSKSRNKSWEHQLLTSILYDIVAQISKSFPGKDRFIWISSLDIQLDDLILEGKVQDKGEFDMLHRSLESLYSKVVLVRSAPPTSLRIFPLL